MKTAIGVIIFWVLLGILGLIGEIRCIVKAVNCDWEAPYKAEAIYTVGACTATGAIIGWIHIDDGKKETKSE